MAILILITLLTLAYSKIPHLGIILFGFDVKMWIYYILLSASIPYIFRLAQHSRLDRFLEELSFPIYITHLAVISTLKQVGVSNIFLILTITFAASLLLVKLVIQPIDKIRSLRVNPR